MILTSRILNFLSLGSINETLCSRLFRRWAAGSKFSGLLIKLIDAGFERITGEKGHVFRSYKAGRK